MLCGTRLERLADAAPRGRGVAGAGLQVGDGDLDADRVGAEREDLAAIGQRLVELVLADRQVGELGHHLDVVGRALEQLLQQGAGLVAAAAAGGQARAGAGGAGAALDLGGQQVLLRRRRRGAGPRRAGP
jgi:hypothetical protein